MVCSDVSFFLSHMCNGSFFPFLFPVFVILLRGLLFLLLFLRINFQFCFVLFFQCFLIDFCSLFSSFTSVLFSLLSFFIVLRMEYSLEIYLLFKHKDSFNCSVVCFCTLQKYFLQSLRFPY